MLAKIIVGLAGVLAVGGGAYLYFDHSGTCPMGRNSPCQQTALPAPEVSVQHSCCSEQNISTSETQSEVLEIMPREVSR